MFGNWGPPGLCLLFHGPLGPLLAKKRARLVLIVTDINYIRKRSLESIETWKSPLFCRVCTGTLGLVLFQIVTVHSEANV